MPQIDGRQRSVRLVWSLGNYGLGPARVGSGAGDMVGARPGILFYVVDTSSMDLSTINTGGFLPVGSPVTGGFGRLLVGGED